MWNKTYALIAVAALAVGTMLATADSGYAQHQRGRASVGVHIGSGGVGVHYGRPSYYYPGHYYGGYYPSHYYSYPYRYYGYGYPRYYEYDYWPSYSYVTPSPTYYYYGTQRIYVPVVQTEAAPLSDSEVRFTVRVPVDATIWINDAKTTQTGEVREFVSSGLTPGKKYTYAIRAKWKEAGKDVERTESIKVQGGERRMVSFPAPSVE